jgi:hypothetical protein
MCVLLTYKYIYIFITTCIYIYTHTHFYYLHVYIYIFISCIYVYIYMHLGYLQIYIIYTYIHICSLNMNLSGPSPGRWEHIVGGYRQHGSRRLTPWTCVNWGCYGRSPNGFFWGCRPHRNQTWGCCDGCPGPRRTYKGCHPHDLRQE